MLHRGLLIGPFVFTLFSFVVGGRQTDGMGTMMELMTLAEKQMVETRLAELVGNRPGLARRISEARDLGDLKENGDYHAAREQQGMEEAEIRRLQDRLLNISLIDERMSKAVEGVVFIGSTVRLRDTSDGDEDLFKLVGESAGTAPADYVEVTATSPMGEALLKSRVGDIIRVSAPRGEKKFEIMEIM